MKRGVCLFVSVIFVLSLPFLPTLRILSEAKADVVHSGWVRLATGGLGDSLDQMVIPSLEFRERLFFTSPPTGTNSTVPLWTYDGSSFTKATADGFGNKENTGLYPTAVFDENLFCGTLNEEEGCELWKSSDGLNWMKIFSGGLGDKSNTECIPLGVQEGMLLVSFANEISGVKIYGFNGSSWKKLNDDGFGDPANTQTSLGVLFKEKVHFMVNNTGGVNHETTPYVYEGDKKWKKLAASDFGDQNNEESFLLSTDGQKLYVSVVNYTSGGEVWSYNGSSWSQVGTDGMGDMRNSWVTAFPFQGRVYLSTGGFGPPNLGRKIYRQRHDGTWSTCEDESFGNEKNLIVILNTYYKGNFIASTMNTGGFEVWSRKAFPSDIYYFAEGTTRNNSIDGTYEEWISILNPEESNTKVHLTYMFEKEKEASKDYILPAKSRLTINVASEVGEQKDVSVKVTGDDPIIAERPMYFIYKGKWDGGHVVMGSVKPSKTHYFAEGTTRSNLQDGEFEQWLCIQNPSKNKALLTVTYMLGDRSNLKKEYAIAASKRITLSVNEAVGPDKDVSTFVESSEPVVCERPMYFNYQGSIAGGHDVVGAEEPSLQYLFAEGCTYAWASEWLCIQNPGSAEASVEISFHTKEGESINKKVNIHPKSRHTTDVKAAVGLDKDVSISITSTQPIVAERPMYFDYQGKWAGGHDAIGRQEASNLFYFAEGTTRWNEIDGFFDGWVCLLNPSKNDGPVRLTFVKFDGTTQTHDLTIGANSRFTVSANQILGPDVDAGLIIESSVPIVAERPMYFDYHGFAQGGDITTGLAI
ncbi:MAG: DUF5719 family protein [Actinomycetota bacterium]|nr:DUF5719 family protein [Actinomycetota bacterium]